METEKNKEFPSKKERFFIVNMESATAVMESKIKESSKLVWFALSAFKNNQTGICFPSITRICSLTNLSYRTVQRGIRQLEEAGFIESQRNANAGKSNVYKFTDMTPLSHHTDGDMSDVTYQDERYDTGDVCDMTTVTKRYDTGDTLTKEVTKESNIKNKYIDDIRLAYPKKTSPKDSRKAIAKALKDIEPLELLRRTKLYAESTTAKTTPKGFIKHCATWFNKGCYLEIDDDPKAWDTPYQNGNIQNKFNKGLPREQKFAAAEQAKMQDADRFNEAARKSADEFLNS